MMDVIGPFLFIAVLIFSAWVGRKLGNYMVRSGREARILAGYHGQKADEDTIEDLRRRGKIE